MGGWVGSYSVGSAGSYSLEQCVRTARYTGKVSPIDSPSHRCAGGSGCEGVKARRLRSVALMPGPKSTVKIRRQSAPSGPVPKLSERGGTAENREVLGDRISGWLGCATGCRWRMDTRRDSWDGSDRSGNRCRRCKRRRQREVIAMRRAGVIIRRHAERRGLAARGCSRIKGRLSAPVWRHSLVADRR